ncbi:hypothetical protein [Rubricoccus marinus]|nr:hypothetical protein [Rubricoccus marinus]
MARLVSATLLTIAALALILNASGEPEQQAQSAQPDTADAIVLVAD